MKFSITRPGTYRLRCGDTVEIERGPESDAMPWWQVGRAVGDGMTWDTDGTFRFDSTTSLMDIVDGPLDDPPRVTTVVRFSVAPSHGMTGYVAIRETGAFRLHTLDGFDPYPGTVTIDLAQVPQSAIVMLPPVRHEGWINVYADGGDTAVHDTRADADREASAEAVPPGRIRIACIRVEFKTGEGLEG